MSRENFAVKVTSLDGATEYVVVHNIFRLREEPAKEGAGAKTGTPAHTLITTCDGFSIQVRETAKEIQQKAGAFGTFKLME